MEWGRRNAAPKVRGQFKRVFEDMILKAVFRSLSRKAADDFDWVYRHHIDWEPRRGPARETQVSRGARKGDVA